MRGVSQDSPFNIASSYLDVTIKLPKKTGRLTEIGKYDELPLAGRFSEIGERLVKNGSKNACHITTGPWGEIFIKDSEA